MFVTLIGYRGCGKSSVGPLLAQSLQCPCVDTDDVIESRSGTSIREIFELQGEPEFRRLETDVLKDLFSGPAAVIAAGGGAILADVNRQLMKAAGPVVWLNAGIETLAERISRDASSENRRPSLTGRSVEQEVADVLNSRRDLYADAASIIVDADQGSPEQIAEIVLSQLAGRSGEGAA